MNVVGTIELRPSTTQIAGSFNFLDSAGLEPTALLSNESVQISGGLSGRKGKKIRDCLPENEGC